MSNEQLKKLLQEHTDAIKAYIEALPDSPESDKALERVFKVEEEMRKLPAHLKEMINE